MSINLIKIFLVVLLSSSYSSVKAQNKDLISDTCLETPNYSLCYLTLKADPRSSTADVAGLGFIIIENVKDKSDAELKSITELLSNSDPAMKQRLSQCVEDYKMILSAFIPEAEQAIGGNPKFAEDGMSSVAHVSDRCVQSLTGLKEPLPTTNNVVHNLSLVAVAIIRKLL